MSTPTGIITAWYGLLASIPSGWVICDGASGTPDLRNMFVIGASIDSDVNTTTGSLIHNHTCPSLSSKTPGSHSKSGTSGASSGAVYAQGASSGNKILGSHTHSYTMTASHSSHSHSVGDSDYYSNLPTYYKLFYIMKV